MKTSLLKTYFIISLILCNLVALAQPGSGTGDGTLEGNDAEATLTGTPGTGETGGGSLEGVDAPVAPINHLILFPAFAAVLLGIYSLNKKSKKA